jgi:hypothetical protein
MREHAHAHSHHWIVHGRWKRQKSFAKATGADLFLGRLLLLLGLFVANDIVGDIINVEFL